MIKNIQYLRFLAAFLVILSHANLQMYGVSAQVTNMGGFGVDIFFIISGFIMPYILYGGMYKQDSQLRMTAGGFLLRRIIRIWPLYLIIILSVMFVSGLVASGTIKNPSVELAYFFNSSKLEPSWLLETMTFTHWSRPPILSIGWTLQFEFIFYVAISLILLMKAKKIESLEIGTLGIFLVLSIISLSTANAPAFLKTMASPIIFEFIMGFMLYRIVSSGVLMHKSLALLVAVATIPVFILIEMNLTTIIDPQYRRLLISGTLSFLLVWAALSLETYTRESKLFELLGDASYSLYLVHGVVAPIYLSAWLYYGLDKTISIWIYTSSYIIFCHAAGLLTHLRIEKPTNNLLKRLILNKSRRTIAPTSICQLKNKG